MNYALILMLSLAADPLAAEHEMSAAINEAELKAHVYRLTGPEFVGRKGEGADRAAEHLAAAFTKLKLQPAFGDSYFQPIAVAPSAAPSDKKARVGRNVGGFIPGSDPSLADEWIILSAHYDHIGFKDGRLCPGADDNASGVAMLLEVAEAFALGGAKPKRSVYFVSFDLEEVGLLGSKHFAAHPPRDLNKLRSFLVADILGRSMGDVMEEYLFVLGSEMSPRLRRLVQDVPPEKGLKVGRLGTDLVGTRSDYGPFRDRQIPYLFFTTGTHRDYHKPGDLPEKLDYGKMTKISRWIERLTQELADTADPPTWAPIKEGDLNEVETVRELVQRALDRPKAVVLSDAVRTQLVIVRDRLTAILARKAITPEERAWLVATARWGMLLVY